MSQKTTWNNNVKMMGEEWIASICKTGKQKNKLDDRLKDGLRLATLLTRTCEIETEKTPSICAKERESMNKRFH